MASDEMNFALEMASNPGFVLFTLFGTALGLGYVLRAVKNGGEYLFWTVADKLEDMKYERENKG